MGEIYIGVMSGTSLDGIDVVIIEFSDKDENDENIKRINVKQSYSHSMPIDIKKDVLSMCQGQKTTLSEVGDLNRRLGIVYAEAINEAIKLSSIDPNSILAIGCHGQTVWHQPPTKTKTTTTTIITDSQKNDGFTIQLGDCNRIATLTGITTIGDFRNRDISYGGQGAPLTPSFHKYSLSSSKETRIILNIGGISNITLLPSNNIIPVTGFDTGPGNILLDSWIQLKMNGKPYDKDGEWANQGKINELLLKSLYDYSSSFLNKLPPKSTGRELFNIQWLLNVIESIKDNEKVRDEDVQATLLEFTCRTIVDEIIRIKNCKIDRVLVCGGGCKNKLIMNRLSTLLKDYDDSCKVSTTDEFGINSQDMEAIAFAWFAKRTLNHQTSNLISVTGASKETILGAIYLKNNFEN
ncbi:hypothetical protein RB653_000839 [Dictyostelium firmibasis]|uniref:Anhydro-N-acetylmuramic acid kinase n=1 Tax=Dictyostelium firmibasis TaxID=79012 RepID=A0AAN7U7G2_9MYCE